MEVHVPTDQTTSRTGLTARARRNAQPGSTSTTTRVFLVMLPLSLAACGLLAHGTGTGRAAPTQVAVVGAPAAVPPALVVNGQQSVLPLTARPKSPALTATARLHVDAHTHTVRGVDLVITKAGTPADASALLAGSAAVISRAALDPQSPVAPPGLMATYAGHYAVYALIHYTDPDTASDGWVAQPIGDLTVR